MIKTLTTEEFRNTTGISYSKLSKLADGPGAYKASLEEKEFTLGLAFGALVDILLTDPKKFDTEFYVMTSDKPSSEMMLKFCEIYAQTDDPQQAHAASGFKISLDATLSKFYKEGKPYYDALIAGKGKNIVDADMVMKATQAVTTLKSNPYTSKYIVPSDEIEILFQVNLVWDMRIPILPLHAEQLDAEGNPDYERFTIKAKGIIDIVQIDHKEKLIQPIELKTGGEGFWKGYFKYRRYLQGSMYYYGLQQSLEDHSYHVLNPKFIYFDSNLSEPPLIYAMNKRDVWCGRMGYEPVLYDPALNNSLISKMRYKGYEQLASELDWHIRNNLWDYSYDIYMSNGETIIDAFNPKF